MSYRHAAPWYDDQGHPRIRHRLDGPDAAHGKHRKQHGKVYIFGGWGAMLACLPLAWTVIMAATGIYQTSVGGTRIIPAQQPAPPTVERVEPAPGRSGNAGGSPAGTTAAPGPTNQPGSSSTDLSTPTTDRSTPTTDPTVAPEPGTAAGQILPTPGASPSCMPKPKKQPEGKPSLPPLAPTINPKGLVP